MADSKITQLPLSPYALDKDLMIVVTGHLEEGAYPYNTRMPLSYVRRYIVRLNLMTIPTSGISTYYNSGLNVLTLQHTPLTGNLMRYDYDSGFPHDQTISTTGLNAIVGNNIDIAFKSNSDASQSMNGGAEGNTWDNNFVSNNLGAPYHSGIISVTGLNAYSGAPYGNLVRVDFDVDQWPYSGVISTTGLNSIKGNLVDVQFEGVSDAAVWMHNRDGSWQSFDKNNHLGNKYHSGIISITGLNAYSGSPYGNLMRVDFDVDQWPYSGVLSTTGLNSIVGNNMDIVFSSGSLASQGMSSRNGTWPTFSMHQMEGKYHSGIISTTGLNAHRRYPHGNLMRIDFDSVWPYSGVISQTGLNVIKGNLVDVQFTSSSDAALRMHSYGGPWDNEFNRFNHLGETYHSGIISVTGLNTVTENLIVRDYESTWPYSGIIYNTGLNASAGNRIAIDHSTSSSAHSTHGGAGGKYQSGIISTTGLNLLAGAGIGYSIESSYPHEYNVFTTDKASYPSTSVTITNDAAEFVSNTSNFQVIKLLDFSDFYTSRAGQSPKFLVEAAFKITSISKGSLPSVGGFGTLNDRKSAELQPTIGQNFDGDIIAEGDLSSFIPFGGETYAGASFSLQIGISGGGANSFNNNISTYPITFKNHSSNFSSFYEAYRSGSLDYKPPIYNELNYQDPIIIRAGVDLNIDSASTTVNNTCGLVAKISNVRYIRGYSYDSGPNVGTDTFYTTNTYVDTSATIKCLYVKTQEIK